MTTANYIQQLHATQQVAIANYIATYVQQLHTINCYNTKQK